MKLRGCFCSTRYLTSALTVLGLLFAAPLGGCTGAETGLNCGGHGSTGSTSNGVGGSSSSAVKDNEGWLHVWVVRGSDHEYDADVLAIKPNGDVDLQFRRMVDGVVVDTRLDGVPCWKAPVPVAITAGPHGMAFVFPTADPRDSLVGLIVGTSAPGRINVATSDGKGGTVTANYLNGDDVVWPPFPYYIPSALFPSPDGPAEIVASVCHAPSGG